MSCLVCDHPDGNAMDAELLTWAEPVAVGVRHGVDGPEVIRHVREHWHPLVADMLLAFLEHRSVLSADDTRWAAQLFAEIPRESVRKLRYRRMARPARQKSR